MFCLALTLTQNKIIVDKQDMYNHFSDVSTKYRDVRTLDMEPVLHIKNQLDCSSKINMADVGCGDGRYSMEFLRHLKDRCYMHCMDCNKDMLKSLEHYLTRNNTTNFCTREAYAGCLPLDDGTIDCIVTFNAIHHFDVPKFLSESQRSLNSKGHLFIYTRLKSQNSESIWGKHFPLFAETETRLYEIDELKRHIHNAGMNVHSTRMFKYLRTSSLDRLVYQAESNHYSTFAMYDKKSFQESLKAFKQNIKDNFDDLENIKWVDQNILIEIKK